MRTNVCADCGRVFEVQKIKGALPQRCPEHQAERKAAVDRIKAEKWRNENRDRARAHWNKHNRKRLADPAWRESRSEAELVRKYGVTLADYETMLAEQGGVCAICKGARSGPGKRFHVDHCHNSKKVRGLLCGNCNTAIGLLGDDPARAESAAAYLRR